MSLEHLATNTQQPRQSPNDKRFNKLVHGYLFFGLRFFAGANSCIFEMMNSLARASNARLSYSSSSVISSSNSSRFVFLVIWFVTIPPAMLTNGAGVSRQQLLIVLVHFVEEAEKLLPRL